MDGDKNASDSGECGGNFGFKADDGKRFKVCCATRQTCTIPLNVTTKNVTMKLYEAKTNTNLNNWDFVQCNATPSKPR